MPSKSEAAVTLAPLCEVSHQISDSLKQFDCGIKELNKFARNQLIKRDEQGKVKAVAAVINGELAAFITLAPHQLAPDGTFLTQSYATVPVLVIEQIATQVKYQHNGIATMLIARALKSASAISDMAGISGVALWAHPDAVSFYEKVGFIKLRTKSSDEVELTQMFMSIYTIRDSLRIPAAALA